MNNKLLNQYYKNGYVRLGKLFTNNQLEKLKKRVKDLMLGKIRYENMFFQLESHDGKYSTINKNLETFVGPSLRYRKIKDLEYDDLFNKIFQKKIVKFCSERLIGKNVSCMRAMIFNKSYKNSSILPFHQDVSNDWNMSLKPKFTIWMSLNGANKNNGCLKVINGSHRLGVINKGHLIDEKNIKLKGMNIEYIELKSGEAILFDNHLVHGSDKNKTRKNRLAFTVCLLDGKAIHLKTKKKYPKIYGKGAIDKKLISKVKKLKKIPNKVYH